MALSVTSGCAHFREGAERARGQDGGGSTDSPAAPLPPPAPRPVPVAPTPPPAPRPAPLPEPAAPPAPAPAPAPAAAPDDSKAQAASRKAAAAADRAAQADSRKAQAAAEKAQHAQDRAQDKAARRAEKAAPPAPAPVREPIAATGPTVDRVPAPQPMPAPAPVPTPVPMAPPASDEPASTSAIVTFASTSGTQCGACETLKISVSPGGKVLIEQGHFSGGDWRYRRSNAHTTPERAAAFAARLAAWRPHGRQAPTCAAPAGQDSGVAVEWFEMGRHDQLNVSFACTDAQTAEALRSAPALLGLRQLSFPWSQGR